MRTLIDLQKLVCPEALDLMQKRHQILHTIHLLEPIGRRNLANQVALKERVIRTELDFLTERHLLEVTTKGVRLTRAGIDALNHLKDYVEEINGFRVLETEIKQTLNLDRVIITPGDSDVQEWVKYDLGRRAVQSLHDELTSHETVALTGGTTMAAVAEMMQPTSSAIRPLFVPARGGLGERMENQANTIAAEMAKRINGDYRMLYVPDPLSEETYHSIIREPGVKEVLHMIKQADVVMHGIGDALTMANRRKASKDVLEELNTGRAVSEAFGYYFDQSGQVVHKVRTVGIQLEDLSTIKTVIAVAGGKSKAKAIDSYLRQGKSNVLITDEAAAKALIKGFSL
ncbi:central glycolytic genes regulator [Pelagirhabdus alkalitolerans]|uniref:Central glycolytic genes regulator n=1 Tax=Pelagirhabdus alkalitolerans TaxID=1612202 RepID=A0A1G6N3R8_9BACI|nr:sugar-binding domain-containing protein [Pelagirhabdus alkalitolerans]SDC62351.1 central glycolytic genes regulator [Pelagirhabdus alkalitolerans]